MAQNSELTRSGDNGPSKQGEVGDAIAFERLSHAFETSAKRWELIVYPSMFAFIILAAYGFYLVFSLAKDVHYMAISIDSNMTVLASNMQSMSDNVSQMSSSVRTMASSVEAMAGDVETLKPMLASMDALNESLRVMTHTTGTMSSDMGNLNRSISRPMGFMNSFMPW
jgi:methyl-accepting chemotaxis protein